MSDERPEPNATPDTSGQNVPKSESKFREKSNTQNPSEKLHQGADASSFADNAKKKQAKQMQKSAYRAERTGAKLETATKKRDSKKPQKAPGVIKSVRRAAQFELYRYAHGKVYQSEHENVGVEAAHKTEIAGERVAGTTKRFIQQRNRTRPARRVQKWTKRDVKAKSDLAYKKLVQDNPELRKKAVSRFFQKQRLKRKYQKQARQAAKKGAKAAKKTAVTTEKMVVAVGKFVARHPMLALILGAVFLFILILHSCMGTVTMVGNGMTGAVGTASYVAADADIDNAELAYTEWETDLQIEINSTETTQPGYDEYRYNVGVIGHDPYELMAFLTAAYDNFTYSGVESVLREIFAEQYTLTTQEITETRETDNGDGTTTTEEISVLETTLAVRSLADVLNSRMTGEQLERYNILVMTKGNRQYVKGPFDISWLPYVTSNYGYRVHPISGEKDYHTGADIALPEGTDILAAQTGTVTFAAENGGYGLMVIIDGGDGIVTKYAHCSVLLVNTGQTVQAGDAIARIGSTGNSTGPHLHFEVLKDGQYLNPLYFSLTNDIIQ